MKYVSILIFTLLVSACSGSKKAIVNQANQTDEVTMVTKVPDAVEPENEVEVETQTEVEIQESPTPPKPKEMEVLAPIATDAFDHSAWNSLLQKNVSDDGKVSYKGFKTNSKELQIYIDLLTKNMPKDDWSKNDKLAYWINAYNALTVDLILRNFSVKSIKDIKDPWDQRLWKFGDKWENLNDIEHVILRNMDEPRIHFAIVCASVSCPKLQNEAFIASKLDTQLTDATKEFLADTSKNELSENNIKLSKIFKWFKKDFEQNGSLIDFLNQYAHVTISESAKKGYTDYDWNLNN